MSSIIESYTRRRELRRAEELNQISAEGEQRKKTATETLLQGLARRELQAQQEAARVKMETELHRAEMELREKNGDFSALLPASHPQDAEAERVRQSLRGLVGKILPQKD